MGEKSLDQSHAMGASDIIVFKAILQVTDITVIKVMVDITVLRVIKASIAPQFWT